MKDMQKLNRNFEAITWGALFVWWGITEMVQFLPTGSGPLGIGLILLAVNFARWRSSVAISRFSTTIGVLALVWGGLELAGVLLSLPFDIPVFAGLLIVLGILILAPALFKKNPQEA